VYSQACANVALFAAAQSAARKNSIPPMAALGHSRKSSRGSAAERAPLTADYAEQPGATVNRVSTLPAAADASKRPAKRPSSTDAFVARAVAHPRIDLLKLIAIVAMVVDHLNTIWFAPGYPAWRAIGRLAFPLFAFVLAFNFVRHTRHPARFVGRLFLWGLVSQLFYEYAFGGGQLNILFTLALGLGYAAAFRAGPWALAGTGFAVALVSGSKLLGPIAGRLDFGIEGVLLVFVFAQAIERPTGWRGGLALLFAAAVNPWREPMTDLVYAASAAAGVVLIAATAHRPGEWRWMRRGRVGFYFFYPAHLFVLKALAPG